MTTKSLSWDTTGTPDGRYLLKVLSSNKYARPTEQKSGEAVIDIIVDNTPPTIALPDKVTGMEQLARLQFVDALTPIAAASYRLDDGPWVALLPTSGVFNSKRQTVLLLSPDGKFTLSAGEHKLILQALDAAGNKLERTITVVIP